MRTKSFSDSVTPFLTKRKKSACAKAQTDFSGRVAQIRTHLDF